MDILSHVFDVDLWCHLSHIASNIHRCGAKVVILWLITEKHETPMTQMKAPQLVPSNQARARAPSSIISCFAKALVVWYDLASRKDLVVLACRV